MLKRDSARGKSFFSPAISSRWQSVSRRGREMPLGDNRTVAIRRNAREIKSRQRSNRPARPALRYDGEGCYAARVSVHPPRQAALVRVRVGELPAYKTLT
jgi:hypothetical protein